MKRCRFFALPVLLALMIMMSSVSFAFTTASKPPITADDTELKWSLRLGTDYKSASSIPTIFGDYLYVMSGTKLYKLDKENGNTIKTADLAGRPTYAYIPVLVSGNTVFCPIGDGVIQAFNADTLALLWSYTDTLGGQALTPIACFDGKIYTGFWNTDTTDANFVCLDAANGKCSWSLTRKGGYYWAECAKSGNFIVIGGEDGTENDDGANKIYSVTASEGTVVGSADIVGDMRSGVANSGGALYFMTKGAFLYKTSLNSDGSFTPVKSVSLTGYGTSTPSVYNGRVYVGIQGSGLNDGIVAAYDAQTLEEVSSVHTPGFPQSQLLICTGYDTPVIYATCNNGPGGIVAVTYGANDTLGAEQIFIPAEESRSFCISTITADDSGVLYYKNDSGTIFAVGHKSDDTSESKKTIIDYIRQFFTRISQLFTRIIRIIKSIFRF